MFARGIPCIRGRSEEGYVPRRECACRRSTTTLQHMPTCTLGCSVAPVFRWRSKTSRCRRDVGRNWGMENKVNTYEYMPPVNRWCESLCSTRMRWLKLLPNWISPTARRSPPQRHRMKPMRREGSEMRSLCWNRDGCELLWNQKVLDPVLQNSRNHSHLILWTLIHKIGYG